MATLEVDAERSITIFEENAFGGISLKAVPSEDGWVWLAFGQSLLNEFPGREDAELRIEADVSAREDEVARCLHMPIAEVLSAFGEAYGWTAVKVNGSTVWSSEATEAVKEALELPDLPEDEGGADVMGDLGFPDEDES